MKLCSDFMAWDDDLAANQCFRTFIVGSDQIWNWNLDDTPLRRLLDFTDEKKRLIAYAPSFGANRGGEKILMRL